MDMCDNLLSRCAVKVRLISAEVAGIVGRHVLKEDDFFKVGGLKAVDDNDAAAVVFDEDIEDAELDLLTRVRLKDLLLLEINPGVAFDVDLSN